MEEPARIEWNPDKIVMPVGATPAGKGEPRPFIWRRPFRAARPRGSVTGSVHLAPATRRR
jgi:hypothetical protein